MYARRHEQEPRRRREPVPSQSGEPVTESATIGNAALAQLLQPAPRPQGAATRDRGAGPLDADLDAAIRAEAGGGAPLARSARTHMEQQFGLDLSTVRVHTGTQADALSQSLQARAFTTGTDVFFSSGSYQPDSLAGQELIAHELTHVVQQAGGEGGTESRVSHPEEPAEVEAREVARFVTTARLAPLVDPALLSSLQRSAGNQAVVRLLRQARGPVQRNGDVAAPAPSLDQEYRQALLGANQTGDWQGAAEKLNGFNRADMLSRLAELSDEQVAYLHLGAVGNPRVGPQSQVALLTMPGAPRASTEAPGVTPAPAGATGAAGAPEPAVAGRLLSDMSATEKLVEAFHRANINAAVREKILSIITPEALVAAIISFAAVFIASQFTPVGWAADLAIGLTAIFVGSALFTAAQHLINFAAARNAATTEQLDRAGEEFARAVAEIEVDAILLLVTHAAGGGARGGTPYEGPPPSGLVLATAEGRLVPVAVETIPVEIAGQLGVVGGATAMTMSGRPGSGPRTRDFEPPVRDHQGKAGGDIPENGAERKLAVDSWTREELELAAEELERSIAARQAEQAALGETSVGAQGQQVGAAHRVRIDNEIELLRAIRKKLSGS